MPIKTQQQSVITSVDPLSLHSEMRVVSGNPVQTFNNETAEYEPDRTLVPLILMPYVYVVDPEGKQNGMQTFTAVEWYEGAPKKNYSNRIAAGTDYEIGDGTVSGFPKNALKVKKNVPSDSPVHIYAIVAFTDVRTKTSVKIDASIQVYTTVYESRNYKLAVNRPSSWYINPVTETGEWQHTITAQLYSGKEPVADSHAAYWWQVKEENGDWRDITAEDEELWLTCKSNGVFTKNLTFDARMFKTASFRVTAAYYEDTRPGNPAKSYLQCDTTVIVMVPGTLRVAQRQTRGGKVASDFSTEEGFELTAHDNRREYDDAMTDSMLQIRWKGKSAKAGSSETFIDSGRSVNFIPKDKGFDSAYPVAVWAEASVYAKHKVLTDDSGKVVTDDSGKIVIVPIYE